MADERRLDGNAIGGLLLELFGVEMTTATGICASCGAMNEMAGTEVYLDAPGVVVRCASCKAVQLTIVRAPDRTWLNMSGLQAIEIRGGA